MAGDAPLLCDGFPIHKQASLLFCLFIVTRALMSCSVTRTFRMTSQRLLMATTVLQLLEMFNTTIINRRVQRCRMSSDEMCWQGIYRTQSADALYRSVTRA